MESRISKWKSEWKKHGRAPKKEQLAVLLLFGILLVVIALPVSTTEEKKETIEEKKETAEAMEATYERQLEDRLASILSQVAGAGRVRVMVTLESKGERIVEKDTPETRKTVEETDAAGGSRSTSEQEWGEETVYYEARSGEKSPYVVKELEPSLEGVLVLAEGGGSPVVRQELLEAVQALFSIEAHKIKIMKLEGAK